MLPAVPLIETVAKRHLAGDIDTHRITFPVLDQRLLAKISVHEFVAAELDSVLRKTGWAVFQSGGLARMGLLRQRTQVAPAAAPELRHERPPAVSRYLACAITCSLDRAGRRGAGFPASP